MFVSKGDLVFLCDVLNLSQTNLPVIIVLSYSNNYVFCFFRVKILSTKVLLPLWSTPNMKGNDGIIVFNELHSTVFDCSI